MYPIENPRYCIITLETCANRYLTFWNVFVMVGQIPAEITQKYTFFPYEAPLVWKLPSQKIVEQNES